MKHFLMFSLVIFVAACSPRQEPLNIAGGTYLGYQPFFLTQEILLCDTCPPNSNFIGGRPMNLHMLPSTTTVLRLFQAEELDGVLLTLGEAITLHQQSAANVCIAEVLSYSENADAILVRDELDPAQPFVVGYEQSPFGGYMLSRAVSLLGWDASLIHVRYVSPREHMAALLNEEIDALITFEPYVTRLLAKNANVVFSGASIDLPRSLSDIYFFDRSNRNEMSTEKLNALIARFNDYKNIQAGGPALQRCDAQEGGV